MRVRRHDSFIGGDDSCIGMRNDAQILPQMIGVMMLTIALRLLSELCSSPCWIPQALPTAAVVSNRDTTRHDTTGQDVARHGSGTYVSTTACWHLR